VPDPARRARGLPELHAGRRQRAGRRAPLVEGELTLLYVAPERVLTARFLGLLGHARLAGAVRDRRGALRQQWGHDFRPEYRQLTVLHERWPQVPRIALTATADALTRAEIVERLAAAGGAPVRQLFRPPEHPLHHRRGKARRAQAVAEFPARGGRATPASSIALSRRKVDETAEFLRDRGYPRAGLPRRHGRQRARATPDPLPARGRRGDGGYDRLRHGHRQAGCALRRAPGPAQIDGSLLPGNRPRRARWRSGRGLDGLWPGRCGAAAPDDR
jgi:hypothetical protein